MVKLMLLCVIFVWLGSLLVAACEIPWVAHELNKDWKRLMMTIRVQRNDITYIEGEEFWNVLQHMAQTIDSLRRL